MAFTQQRYQLREQRAFTLIEVLVVMVIIGVIVSIASVSVRVLGRDSELEDQMRRLAAVMTQAKEEAELQGREVGVLFDRVSYRFFWFDARQQSWIPALDDDLLATRTLPEGLQLRLWLEGREVVLKDQGEVVAENHAAKNNNAIKDSDNPNSELTSGSAPAKIEGPAPQVTLLSSGEVNSFEVRVEREGTDHTWRVASQADNTLVAEEFNAAI